MLRFFAIFVTFRGATSLLVLNVMMRAHVLRNQTGGLGEGSKMGPTSQEYFSIPKGHLIYISAKMRLAAFIACGQTHVRPIKERERERERERESKVVSLFSGLMQISLF